MVDSDEDRKKTIKWWEPLVPLGLVMAWLGGISLGFVVILDRAILGDQSAFLLTAALGGALGGLTGIAGHLISYFRSWQLWSEARSRASAIQEAVDDTTRFPQRWNPINNLLIKPLLYPIGGIVAGLILALVFLETGVSTLRVLLLSLVGGVLWPTVLDKLPKMYGLERQDKK